MKKAILALAGLGLIATPIVATVSCSSTIKKTYDLGLATAPINSLNYIKYKNTATVVPSMVEGLFKSASSDKTIQQLLNFPTLNFEAVDGTDKNAAFSSSYLSLDSYGYLPGSLISTSQGTASAALTAVKGDPTNYSQLAFQLTDKHKWAKNQWNDKYHQNVTPEDYVDAIKYILDLNTGSQLQIDLLEYGIKNADTIVKLQNQYYAIFEDTYKDPFGYDGQWELQQQKNTKVIEINGKKVVAKDYEKELVQQIKEAALGLGVFSGKQYRDLEKTAYAKSGKTISELGINNITWVSTASQTKGSKWDESNSLFYQFDASKPLARVKVADMGRRTFFMPVHREWIEDHGGIQKFGIDKQHFLWNSAFSPETINLGPAGFIDLVKDPNYYASDRTVSNRIKIYFQSDETVLASMFEDGYIADVKIPAVHQQRFWANPDIRRFMSKQNGFGTLAFELNLNNGNPALKDENLRKAISYAIDRNALSLVAGQETSFPVTTWTAFGQVRDSYGLPMESYFDNMNYQPVKSGTVANEVLGDSEPLYKQIPVQSYPFTIHNAKQLQFEHVNRTDIGYRPSLANYFLDKYKETNPSSKGVSLTYIYDGSTASKNIGIYLQAQLNKVLGGFVNINIQGLPSNVFETYKTTGKFDILYYNFDSYGTEWDSYIKRFFEKDAVDAQIQKNEGFRDNPSGEWTYGEYFKNLKDEDSIRTQLEIDPIIWNKMKEIATQKSGESSVDWAARRNAFFSKMDANKDWQNDSKIIAAVGGFEKILRDAAPILPLMEVDTYWEAKHLGGIDSAYYFSLQTAYDLLNRPIAGLPGAKNT